MNTTASISPNRRLRSNRHKPSMPPCRRLLAELVRRSGSGEQDLVAKVHFLATLIEAILQQLAEHDSKRVQRDDYKQLLQRWRRGGPGLDAAVAVPSAHLRALIIDDRVPRSDRDAGSIAVLSHMQSLRRLGYDVVFTPAIEFGVADQNTTALDVIRGNLLPCTVLRFNRGSAATSGRSV